MPDAKRITIELENGKKIASTRLKGKKETMKKLVLRVTEIAMGLRCPMQLYLLKTVGPRPPSGAAITGTAFHNSMKVNFKEKAKTGRDAPVDVLTDAFRDSFHEGYLDADWTWEGETPDEMFDHGLTMVNSAHKEICPQLDVASEKDVERGVMIECQDFIIKGTTDLVTLDKLVDFKTARRRWAKDKAKNEIQGFLYPLAIALQEGSQTLLPFSFEVITYAGERDLQPLVEHSKERALLIVKFAERLARMLVEETPVCNPDNVLCSEKWCGWRSAGLCPLFRKGE